MRCGCGSWCVGVGVGVDVDVSKRTATYRPYSCVVVAALQPQFSGPSMSPALKQLDVIFPHSPLTQRV